MQGDNASQAERVTDNLLRFAIHPYQFCLPAIEVLAIIVPPRLTMLPISGVDIAGLFKYQGDLAICIDLRQKFSLPARLDKNSGQLLLGRAADRLLAFWVDEASDIVNSDTLSWRTLPGKKNQGQIFSGYYLSDQEIILNTSIEQLYYCDRVAVSACLQELVSELVGEPLSRQTNRLAVSQPGTVNMKPVDLRQTDSTVPESVAIAADKAPSGNDAREILDAGTGNQARLAEIPRDSIAESEPEGVAYDEDMAELYALAMTALAVADVGDDSPATELAVADTAASTAPDELAAPPLKSVTECESGQESGADVVESDEDITGQYQPAMSALAAADVGEDSPAAEPPVADAPASIDQDVLAVTPLESTAEPESGQESGADVFESDEDITGQYQPTMSALAEDDSVNEAHIEDLTSITVSVQVDASDYAPAPEFDPLMAAPSVESPAASVMPSEPGIAANPIEDNPVTELPVADSMTPNIILSETRQSEHSMPVDEKIFSPQPTVSESGFDTAPQASSEQVINDPGVTSTDARVSAHEVSAAEPLDQHRMTTVAVAIEVLDNKPFANITTSVTDDRDQGRPDTDDSEDVPLSIATNFSAADERKQQGYNPEASGSDRVIVRVTPPADFVDSSLMDLDPVDDSDRSAVHTLPRSTTATSMVSSSVVVLWCMAMLGFLLLVFWLWPAAPDQQQGVQRQALTPVVGDAGEQLPREHPALASSVPLSSSGPSQDMSESSSQSSPRNSSVGSADQGLQEVFRLEDKNLRIRVERDTVVNRPQDTRAIIQSPEIDATLFPVTPVISEISPAPVVESRQAVSERQPLQLSSSEHELAVDDSRLTADIDQVPAPGQTPRSTQATEPPPVAQPRMSIAINNTPSSLSSGSDFQADAGAGIAANLSLVKHTVVRGDTLWHIAIKYLDNPYLYPQLAHLSQIDNPDLIYPGDVVTIEFNANESP